MHPQWGQRSIMLANVTDEQCLCFRHSSKAFSIAAFKLEAMKTAVVPTVALRDRTDNISNSHCPFSRGNLSSAILSHNINGFRHNLYPRNIIGLR